MTDNSPSSGPAGGDGADRRVPMFDPYTGERLQPGAGDSGPRKPAQGHSAGVTLGRKRHRRLLPVVVGLIVLALLGGIAYYVTGPRADAKAREAARAEVAAEKKAESERAAACKELLGPAYRALRSIDSRLNVGMVEGMYTEAVGDAQSEYDQIDADDAEKNKCASYEDLESALTQYAAASTYWNDCIVGDYCTPSESKLQEYWGEAGINLDAVEANGLDAKTQGTGA